MIHRFNPLDDPRWALFIGRHAASSVFHTTGWVEALHRTYGYEPVVYTTSPPEATLTNGIVLCRIRSWLTGRRMVSLPFADHCDPLVDSQRDWEDLWAGLQSAVKSDNMRFIELRPRESGRWEGGSLEKGDAFRLHEIDLRPPLEDLLRGTHRDTIRRKIRRADREGLTCEVGTSDALLTAFFGLMLLTRRRHGLPPQPLQWFRNLIACLGDRVKIRVAFKDGRPVGSIFTLTHGGTLVYKYGCSDARFHNLGTMPFLFWNAVREARAAGLHTLDLGRSDQRNEGLVTFKERWGATSSTLTYLRSSIRGVSGRTRHSTRVSRRLLGCMPERLFVTVGKHLYRHIG